MSAPAERDWRAVGVPILIPDFKDHPSETALLVIDMQYSMASRDYGMGAFLAERFPAAFEYFIGQVERAVVPNISRLLSFFRTANMRVIYITVGPELPDGSDYFPLRRQVDDTIVGDVGHGSVFVKGSKEHEILPSISPIVGELVINKVTRSPFTSTGLDQVLRHLGVKSLVIVGVNTNVCIETTGRDAADHGYKCTLVSDATAAFDEETQNASLRAFASVFGKVESTNDVMERFTSLIESGSIGRAV